MDADPHPLATPRSTDPAPAHAGPFATLELPAPSAPLPAHFMKRWGSLSLAMQGDEFDRFVPTLQRRADEIDAGLVRALLGEVNWRPRLVGAYLAAVKGLCEVDELVARLLLRSDLCFAGKGYCLALACFDTEVARKALDDYLGHYLSRPDLHFDQGDAMAALGHLDARHGTHARDAHLPAWEAFVADKPRWRLRRFDEQLAARLAAVERARGATSEV
ncbi:MAG: hypothetical protein H6825_01175 [Planctomycetes bacterium]|nr:hypothetical protein [Planctomycetota bacterium]